MNQRAKARQSVAKVKTAYRIKQQKELAAYMASKLVYVVEEEGEGEVEKWRR